MALFDSTERKRIEAAVELAEAKTSGELVVAVTKSTDDYAIVRGSLALLVGLAVAHEIQRVFPLGATLLFLLELGLVGVLFAASGLGPVLRLVVPKARRHEAATRRALAAFVELGVADTEGRSGILLFLAERERAVELLADRGIFERVPPNYFDEVVGRLTNAFRRGEAEAGVLAAVGELGELLEKEFPRADDDVDELSNEVRTV